jgi:hypothetical protein
MKKSRILSALIAPAFCLLLTTNCSEEEGVTQSVNDLSSRFSAYSSEVTGAGAHLTISGSELDQVVQIAFGDIIVPKKTFIDVTPASLTFVVPTAAPLGDNEVVLVFGGNGRAFAPNPIEVVARPVIAGVKPLTVITGDSVIVDGVDLNLVTSATIGGVEAVVKSSTATRLIAIMPAGAAAGTVVLQSIAGEITSAETVTACSQDAANVLCKPNLILNGSFEEGSGDNFNNWSKFNGGSLMTATKDPALVYRNGRALKVVIDPVAAGGTSQWRIQMASDLVANLEVGASYTLSAMVKSTNAGSTIRFSTQPSALYQGDTSVGTNWTLISWTFTANVAETRMVFDMGGAVNTTHYVDDVRLVKN